MEFRVQHQARRQAERRLGIHARELTDQIKESFTVSRSPSFDRNARGARRLEKARRAIAKH